MTLEDKDRLLAAFEECSLRGDEFHHADHVRLAFLYLRRFPLLDALRKFSEGLRKFAAASGKATRYHETITWAFLLLINERSARCARKSGRQPEWEEFTADNPDLLDWRNNILEKYYLKETLESECSRSTFVLPDRGLR